MPITICSYNVEYFNRLFNDDNSLKTTGTATEKLNALKNVLNHINPDLVGILEAPNTSTSSGKDTCTCLRNFAQFAGIKATEAMMGFQVGYGEQEVALMYDPDRFTIEHTPGGESGNFQHPKFDGELHHDTDGDEIEEIYSFERPPLETRVIDGQTGREFYILLVHTKSKGVFSAVDHVHLDRENERNRRKLFAECHWIRQRVDDWLADGRGFILMGDVNDGPGMDFYEMLFGRSAVEIIMGDIFDPDRILRNPIGRPRWGSKGWKPSSSNFRDRITHQKVNVLIDHIMASPGLALAPGSARAWNPDQHHDLSNLKDDLNAASDHYPVSLQLAD